MGRTREGFGRGRICTLLTTLAITGGMTVAPLAEAAEIQGAGLVYKAKAEKGAPAESRNVTLRGDFRSDVLAGDFIFSGRTHRIVGLASGESLPEEGLAADIQVVLGKNGADSTKVFAVEAIDACGAWTFSTKKPRSLLLPASPKEGAGKGEAAEPLACFPVRSKERVARGTQARATGFDGERVYDLIKPSRLCVPVDVQSTGTSTSRIQESRSRDSLVCYKAKLARSEVPQDGCGPALPGDRGERIDPRPTRHAGVAGVVVDHQLGQSTLDTVKEQEICLPAHVQCPSCTAADPDQDGIESAQDVCPGVSDPAQADLDHDGFGDACDLDADGDRLTDSIEAALGLDPRRSDSDGDGVRDGFDPHPLDADRSRDADAVVLKSRAFVPAAGLDAQVLASGSTTAIVQLVHAPTRAILREFEQNYGIFLHHYVPNRAYIARIDPARLADAAADVRVRAIVAIEPEDRIDPDLRHHGILPAMASADGLIPVEVKFLDGTHPATATEYILTSGGIGLEFGSEPTEFTAEFEEEALLYLSEIEDVLFMELSRVPTVPEDSNTRSAFNITSPNPPSETGSGVVVGMLEALAPAPELGVHPQPLHPDFVPGTVNTLLGVPPDPSPHATQVAGMISGQGFCSANGSFSVGTATGASLVAGVATVTSGEVKGRYQRLASAGASIVNNSWGSLAKGGGYGFVAAALDKAVQGDTYPISPRPLVIKSAGNTRTEFCGSVCDTDNDGIFTDPCTPDTVRCQTMIDADSDGTPEDGFECVSRPANAKNVLTVGAVDNAFQQTCFSANGPTLDGRIKPELMAPGIISDAPTMPDASACLPPGGGVTGTSFAAPSVAGLVALVHEAWISRGLSGVVSGTPSFPLPSTVRALLVHTAQDLDNAGTVGLTASTDGPSFRTGWGMPDAQAAIALLDSHAQEPRIIESDALDDSGDEESFTFTMQPTDVGSQLDITLAWDDHFAGGLTDGQLVNDLDLEVEAPNGFIYHPWKLSFDPTNTAAPPTCRVDTGATGCDTSGVAFGGVCSDTACAGPTSQDRVNNLERVLVPAVQSSQVGIWVVRVTAAAMNQPSVTGGFNQRYSLILPTDNDLDCGDVLEGDAFLYSDLDCSDPGDDGLQIQTDDTTLDCQGFSIVGSGDGTGVLIAGADDVTVRNCEIFDFEKGIHADGPLERFQALDNLLGGNIYGIHMAASDDGEAGENEFVGNEIGLVVSGSRNAVLENEFEFNMLGIQAGEFGVASEDNELEGNLVGFEHHNGIELAFAASTVLRQNAVCNSLENGLMLHGSSSESFVGELNVLCQSGNLDVWVAPEVSSIDDVRDPTSNSNFCNSVNTSGASYADSGEVAGCNYSCQAGFCGGPVDLGDEWINPPGGDPFDPPGAWTVDLTGMDVPDDLVSPFDLGLVIGTLPGPFPLGRKLSEEGLRRIDPETARIHRLDEKTGTFHPLAGSVLSPSGDLVIGYVDRPGTYAVFAQPSQAGPDGTTAGNNSDGRD